MCHSRPSYIDLYTNVMMMSLFSNFCGGGGSPLPPPPLDETLAASIYYHCYRIYIDMTGCQRLHTHTQYGKEGDGYERKSPHTENEKFEGLHLLEAAKVRGHYHFEMFALSTLVF